MLAKHPTAVILPRIVLDPTTVLMHEQVFAKTPNAPVECELLTAIITFGRRRKNLDNEHRIQNVVLLIAGKLRFAANNAAICVGISPR